MSLPPSPPGRAEAIIRLRPSGVSIGQPSGAAELTSVTAAALVHSEREASRPPWARATVPTAATAALVIKVVTNRMLVSPSGCDAGLESSATAQIAFARH